MMNDTDTQNLRTIYAATPPRVKEEIESGKFQKSLEKISAAHKIPQELHPAIENVVLFTLLGVIEIEEMIHELHDIEGLSPEQIDGVVDDVAIELFVPLIEKAQALAGTSGLEENPSSEEKTSISVVPPDHRLPVHTNETTSEEKPAPTPRPQGVDPYREPVE